jgi:hypothetical protein
MAFGTYLGVSVMLSIESVPEFQYWMWSIVTEITNAGDTGD